MNQYALDAKAYYEANLPSQASSMTTQDWTALGESLNEQIGRLAAQLAGPDSPDEPHLDKVARLNTSRTRATEIVMQEQVYSLPPEAAPQQEKTEQEPTQVFRDLTEAQEALLDLEDEQDDLEVRESQRRHRENQSR